MPRIRKSNGPPYKDDEAPSDMRVSPCMFSQRVVRCLMLLTAVSAMVLLACFFADSHIAASSVIRSQPAEPPLLKNPDAACAGCHHEIYERYERTPMAQGSGNAVDGLLQGGFLHAPSGIRYNVFLRDGRAWISYERDVDREPALRGENQLVYYIGSGHRGRTYLYQENGQWFEAPINYYSKKQLWDMAPNYGATKTLPQALPVDSNCLHCHATDVQQSLPRARNAYQGAPFLQGGIGCSACHGEPVEASGTARAWSDSESSQTES